ncbi:MAG: helical backbone metal receptor [Thermoplasmata archaeon]
MFELLKRYLTIALFVIMMCVPGLVNFDNVSAEDNAINITDARGETVEFESPPNRIVSFIPSNTEILYYLGLGEYVVGTDDFSNYPEEVMSLPKVGDSFSVNYEKIVNLSADVVVIPAYSGDVIDTLEIYNQTIVATSSTTVDDIYSDMKMLGKMCGVDDVAENKADGLKAQMEDMKAEGDEIEDENIDVLYMTYTDPIYVPGGDTFQDTLISNAGGHNIASNKTGWPTFSEEEVLAADPDVIIAPESLNSSVNELIEKDVWKEISAVKNDHVYFVDDDIMSRPGPRVVDAQQNLLDIMREVEASEDDGDGDSDIPAPGFHLMMVVIISSALISILRKRRYG